MFYYFPSDVTFFNDLMSPPGADGGRGRRDDGESEEDQDATDAVTPAPGLAVTRGEPIPPANESIHLLNKNGQ